VPRVISWPVPPFPARYTARASRRCPPDPHLSPPARHDAVGTGTGEALWAGAGVRGSGAAERVIPSATRNLVREADGRSGLPHATR
jgi:hypothetical protein